MFPSLFRDPVSNEFDNVARQLEQHMHAAKEAEAKNRGNPTPRPFKNAQMTILEWQMRLMSQEMQSQDHQPGKINMKKTIITGHHSCCYRPLNQLKPITLSQMKVPFTHENFFLVCRTVVKVYITVGTMTLVEDLNGHIEDLSLYNFALDNADASWLEVGTIIIIKEPYLKYGSYGTNLMIRVDSPSDVIFVDQSDKDMLQKLGALKWYKAETRGYE